jgi:HAD superfamily hydrolase (TIGR01450 family)
VRRLALVATAKTNASGRDPVDDVSADRSLRDLSGFVFDLDGCVWNGDVLSPGAGEALSALHAAGRRIGFITNNSRATGADILHRLHRLGVTFADLALTPLEIIGEAIAERYGPSRVLVIGAAELADAVIRGGHEIVEVKDYRRATVVAVGNDFDLTYERLTAAARAARAGAPLVTPNRDPRLPIEGGEFLPGCGAIVAAVAIAAGVRPTVVGKPEATLFRIALRRLGLAARDAAMVGDSIPSDIRGARAVGMYTVLYAPDGPPGSAGPDLVGPAGAHLVVRSFAQLSRLAGVA